MEKAKADKRDEVVEKVGGPQSSDHLKGAIRQEIRGMQKAKKKSKAKFAIDHAIMATLPNDAQETITEVPESSTNGPTHSTRLVGSKGSGKKNNQNKQDIPQRMVQAKTVQTAKPRA